jgi:uncharacterized membrane protein YjjP (DUF1212 family)
MFFSVPTHIFQDAILSSSCICVLNSGVDFISVSTVFLLGVGMVQEEWEKRFLF